MSSIYDKTSAVIDGPVPIGSGTLEQVLSSTPPHFMVAANRTDSPIRKGLLVSRYPGGSGLILAVADSVAHSAFGIAAEDIDVDHAGIVQTSGTFVLEDWTTIIGQPNLSPMAFYYLSTDAGLITQSSPETLGQVSQYIGVAVSPIALSLDFRNPTLL